MRSEAIAEKIMSEVYEEVKSFSSEMIANKKRVGFGEIEDKIMEA